LSEIATALFLLVMVQHRMTMAAKIMLLLYVF